MLQPQVSKRNQVNLSGISDNQLSPLPYRLSYFQPDYRVSGGGISANSQNAGSIANLINGIGHGSAAEGGDQTGHRRGMSETGTMVNIRGTQHCPAKLLDDIVILIGTLG